MPNNDEQLSQEEPAVTTITDKYGQRTTFEGIKLIFETTDTEDGSKPQWAEVDIWRTSKGQYIVRRTTHYRYRHSSERCIRLGPNLVPRKANTLDTYLCPQCVSAPVLHEPGIGVESRSSVDVVPGAAELIALLATTNDGLQSFTGLARSILAEISEQDEAVAHLWMVQVVE